MKGYAGKYLKVDLTNKKYTAEELDENVAKNFIGGYGLGAWTLYNNLKPRIDPLSQENIIAWWTGPVAGTRGPSGSKYTVFSKSPLTGLIGFGICSGGFADELKLAGWDGIVVMGRAEKPTYLFVDDDALEFMDASNLWGKDTWESENLIREEIGDDYVRTSTIGPSGERLVKIANITTDKNRQVGRCGLGAVMGSKNLKSVAVRGTENVEVADLDGLFEFCKPYHKACQGPKTEKYRVYGTLVNVLNLNEMGALPTRNFQQGTFEHAEEVSGERILKTHVKKIMACSACSVGCDHITISKKGSKYAGTVASMDYESLNALGPNCGVHEMDAIIAAVNYCDRLGIDTISGGVIISWAMECFEKGILTKKDTDGLEMRFGNSEAMVEATKRMCLREGHFGNLLAEGTRRAAQMVGKDSIKYAIQIKGLEYGMYGMRALQTATIGFATCVTGAFYQRSGSYQYDTKGKVDRYKLDASRGKLVADGEDNYAIIDSLILCKFTRGIYSSIDEQARMYELVTGIPMTGKELTLAGQRIHNLAKCFNVREGASRKDDYPPPRAFEKLHDHVNKGAVIDRGQYDEALDAYYIYRGWNKEGIPLKAKLLELGLKNAAEEVGA